LPDRAPAGCQPVAQQSASLRYGGNDGSGAQFHRIIRRVIAGKSFKKSAQLL